jgi:hypothetical protein
MIQLVRWGRSGVGLWDISFIPLKRLNPLKPRLMHFCATVVIPFYDCVIFISPFNGAELVCWFWTV